MIAAVVDGQGARTADVLREMATRYTHPAQSARQILDTLRDRYGWVEVHAEVDPHVSP